MFKACILHIGMEKTGTTSIQSMFAANRKRLAAAGYFYSRVMGRDNHVNLVVYARNDNENDNQRKRALAQSGMNLQGFRDDLSLKFAAEAQQHEGKTLLLSNEHLQSRLTTVEEKQRLKDLLQQHCPQIEIYMYVRRQDLVATSLYGTRLLSGNLKRIEAVLPDLKDNDDIPYFYDYRRIYSEYCKVFGRSSVKIRIFDPSELKDGDVCRDYLHWAGIATDKELEIPARKNESIAFPAQFLLTRMNSLNPTFYGNVPNPLRGEADKRLIRKARGKGLMPARRKAEAFYSFFCDDNLRMFEAAGMPGQNFDESFDMFPVRSPIQKIAPGDVADVAVALYRDVVSDLNTLKDELALARARIKDLQNLLHVNGVNFSQLQDRQVNAVETARIKKLLPILRKPEIEHYANTETCREYRQKRLVKIRENFPAVSIDDIRSWDYNPQNHVVWRIYFNSFAWLSAMGPEDAEGNKTEADWAGIKRILIMFLDYLDGHDNDPKNDIWDDHATGYRASYIAYLYAGGLVDHLSPELDRRLRKAMQQHRTKLMEYLASDRWTFSNHTLFQAEGLADLAMVFLSEPDNRAATLKFAADKVDEFVRDAVTHEDGSVKEHSVFYHVFLMGRLLETCDYFKAVGQEITSATDDMFIRMNQFLHDIMPVQGRLPGIGDSKHHQKFDMKYISDFNSDRFRNDRILYHTSGGKRGKKYDFLTQYPTDGYFIFRGDGQPDEQLYSVFLHRSFRGPHGHWDGGSFVCYWKGQPVLIDSGGPYKYSTPMRYKYFVSALGHNSLIFDRDPVQLTTKLLDVQQTDGFGAVALGAEMGKGRFWVRIFAQYRNDALLILDIPVADAGTHSAEIRFHIDPELEVEIGAQPPRIVTPQGTVALHHQMVALETSAADNIRTMLDTGQDVQSNRVDPDKRGAGLDPDFDQRSYVTYKDNEMQEGKLYRQNVPLGQATLTQIMFGSSADEARMTCQGGKICLKITGKSGPDRVELDLTALTLDIF